jgi:serine-type D-Ala-D-Ala carboxypeptidase/endopeptidase
VLSGWYPSLMRHVLAILALGACGGSGPARPVTAAKPVDGDPKGSHEAAVAALVQPLLDAEIAASLVVGLYDAGKLEIYGFGAGPGGKAPTGRTLYDIGSVTKVYTSLLLADAVQRREVELETPVADLLPPGVTVPTRDKQVITLRHLALHSSGLPRLPPAVEANVASPDPYGGYGENQLYADLVRTQLVSTPGTQIAYSNYGVGLLGFALGRKLGTGYTKAITSRILEPLGLADTMFTLSAADASRYAEGTNDELVKVKPWTFDALAGAGALVSTVRDQLKLIDVELDAAAGGKQVLRRAMALTQEPQLERAASNAGLGWQIDAEGRYWHNGGTAGHHAFVGFDTKTRRGVVLLSGTSTSLIDAVAVKLYKVLAGEQLPPRKAPTAEQLVPFAGTYDFAGQQLKIIAQGKRLYVEGPGEPRIRMIPISETQFWIEPLQAIVAFEREGDKVARAVFMVGEQRIAATRTGD